MLNFFEDSSGRRTTVNSQNINWLMRQHITFLTICFLVFMGCTGCTNDKPISPLVGTAWECVEEPEILIFNDNDFQLKNSIYCLLFKKMTGKSN